MTASGPPFRVLPRIDEENHFFWTAGEEGVLRFLRCQACESFVHPPAPRCPTCLSDYLRPETVSGRAVLEAYTLNVHPWIPDSEPYLIGIISIVEQSDVRLMTNIVGAEPEDLRVGMEMQVVFEQADDVWLPLFEPVSVAP